MKTSREITNNIKKGIITKSMLDSALFSVNKRAKNYRDKERIYRKARCYRYQESHTEIACNSKNQMYAYKELFLSILNPICIHKEKGFKRTRVYSYEKDFSKRRKKHESEIVWTNSYYDYNSDTEVFFFDYLEPDFRYYLFYEMPSHTYHSPIEKEDIQNYPELKVEEIDELSTKGEEINDLMSLQTVKKIANLIESKRYTYLEEI